MKITQLSFYVDIFNYLWYRITNLGSVRKNIQKGSI